MVAVGLSVALGIPIFMVFGLYRIVFRHAGADAIMSCAVECAVYGLGYAALIIAYGFDQIPRTVGLLQPVLLFLAVAASRGAVGLLLGQQYRRIRVAHGKVRALIYGVGSTGRQIAEAMASSDEMLIVGFIDDHHSCTTAAYGGCPFMPPTSSTR